jgi:hypothetical protein
MGWGKLTVRELSQRDKLIKLPTMLLSPALLQKYNNVGYPPLRWRHVRFARLLRLELRWCQSLAVATPRCKEFDKHGSSSGWWMVLEGLARAIRSTMEGFGGSGTLEAK